MWLKGGDQHERLILCNTCGFLGLTIEAWTLKDQESYIKHLKMNDPSASKMGDDNGSDGAAPNPEGLQRFLVADHSPDQSRHVMRAEPPGTPNIQPLLGIAPPPVHLFHQTGFIPHSRRIDAIGAANAWGLEGIFQCAQGQLD
jgi:hypothetical protein